MATCLGRWHLSVLTTCLVLATTTSLAEPLPLIDTHSHLDHGGQIGGLSGALEQAIADMDRIGIRSSIFLPPPQVSELRVVYDCSQLRFATRKHPTRVALLGGGGILNPMIQQTPADAVSEETRQRFRALADEVVACGVRGFGEIAAHHLSLGRHRNHPYEWVPPDHPLMLLLADIAAEKGLPIDLHIDMVPADMPRPERPGFNTNNPEVLKANLATFERLLAHNRNARIIWAHAGTDPLLTRTPALQRELLTRHPNLYMSLRPGPAKAGPPAAAAFDAGGVLKQEWLALIRDFADRFVLGSDEFHPAFANSRTTPGVDGLRRLIDQLPPDVAKKVAHENAERLFGKLPE